MRPRVFPAEDAGSGVLPRDGETTSMRPRVFPAEDGRRSGARRHHPRDFNEAAGIPRGRQRGSQMLVTLPRTSMRPRVFPAEDTSSRYQAQPAMPYFNEAAGIPRGRPDPVDAGVRDMAKLQ